jgi:hypothetical protein
LLGLREKCDHDKKETFVAYDDKAYFTAKYLSDNDTTWPSTCCQEGCQSGLFGKDYKVGISNPVYLCMNAKKISHPCKHAYCKVCFQNWSSGQTTPRKRRRTQQPDCITYTGVLGPSYEV